MSGGGRRRGGHGGGSHGSGERWLITYADLITLLLVFFVVMYALSQVDKAKYERLKDSLSRSLNVVDMEGTGHRQDTVMDGGTGVLDQTNPVQTLEQNEMQNMAKRIQEMAKAAELEGMVETKIDDKGLTVSISNAGFFEPGEATLRQEAIPILDDIGRMLKSFNHAIRVEGHTDDLPISTPKYPSNWELSAVRATSMVRFLVERHSLDPHRLSGAGYGEYYPKVPNDTEAHRAQNRRVDIVVLRSAQPLAPTAPGLGVNVIKE